MERRCIVTAVLIISLTVSVCSADEALVGYWAFEEGEGEDVKDLSGLGNDGIIMGQTEWKQGKLGTALAFFKDGQGYVEIVDNETLDIADQITMTAWIKPSDIYIGDDWTERNCIVAKKRAYYLDISETGNLAFYLYNVQPQEWLFGDTDMTDFLNNWVHVAAVYDGGDQKLYVNGSLDASFIKSGTITVNEDNLTIGWVDNNRYFDGIIDEVMIWSRALTEEELSGLLSVSPEGRLTTCWGYLRRPN